MLRSGGAHEGRQLIAEASVELMTTDHLTSGRAAAGVPGGYGGNGGTGTTWRTDVEAELTGILFTQLAMTSPQPLRVFVDFWDAAYAAIDD